MVTEMKKRICSPNGLNLVRLRRYSSHSAANRVEKLKNTFSGPPKMSIWASAVFAFCCRFSHVFPGFFSFFRFWRFRPLVSAWSFFFFVLPPLSETSELFKNITKERIKNLSITSSVPNDQPTGWPHLDHPTSAILWTPRPRSTTGSTKTEFGTRPTETTKSEEPKSTCCKGSSSPPTWLGWRLFSWPYTTKW